ncbi:MAG: mRNA interferase MazF9 [Microgenomates group bacterium Gr01-1014_16]|nr:MAG: mRNA interferase MazF9 [Microgenomates group bacterium Gr01-1014_16]
MPAQSIVNTGDIFLVKFHPGYGSEFQKYRPAVIVSEKITSFDPRFTLIAPLTTNTNIVVKNFEFVISKNPGLEKDSLLLCWYLWTIDATRLIKKLGKLKTVDKVKMLRAVSSLFI